MTNDVILASLIFLAVTLFLAGAYEQQASRGRRLFAAAGVAMVAAFLVKMTLFPALMALGLYSAWAIWHTPAALPRHLWFYLTFAAGLGGICAVYYLATGDPLWQFRSELLYFETYKPDWYLAGHIDYRNLMLEYPRSLFWTSGIGSFTYRDHGWLFWAFVPAAVWALQQKAAGPVAFLVVFALGIFAFFEFYPQYVRPYYLPLVRQTRYLEMLLPAVVIVVGTALHRLARRRRLAAVAIMAVLLVDSVHQASRRALMYDDSQQDVRELARYAKATLAGTGRVLYMDTPARNAFHFYTWNTPIATDVIERLPETGGYVAVGGARSFWWSRDLVADIPPDRVPPHWVLTYRVPGRRGPWRSTDLRVYFAGAVTRSGE